MNHRLIFFLSFVLVSNCLIAKQVPLADAGQAGLRFYSERANQYRAMDPSSFQISESIVVSDNQLPVYYIFNISDKGFVIVSADDAVTPVLAYSFEGIYREDNLSPQFTAWMQQYNRQIDYARKTQAAPSQAVNDKWAALLNPVRPSPFPMKNNLDVEPMITSNWNQPSPYNEMCPADPAGSNGHAIVGCVPVCNGQKTITADTADITDGSLNFNYHNNSACRWMVIPENGKIPFTVYFKSFDTEPSKDVLKILDPDSHDTLAIISGHYSSGNLPDSVTSQSGKMFLVFTSNSSTTADGFHLYYPKSTLGLIEKNRTPVFSVYPNPVHNLINVEFNSNLNSELSVTLSNLLGKPLVVTKRDCQPGKNQLSFPVDLSSGVYLLRLENETTAETFKIIITN